MEVRVGIGVRIVLGVGDCCDACVSGFCLKFDLTVGLGDDDCLIRSIRS